MIRSPSAVPATQIIDGLQVSEWFKPDDFRSAINYKPRPDDIFVATYPKCGTTWTQTILMLIFKQGQPVQSLMDYFLATPYLEFSGVKGAEMMPRPGAIKTHLPFHMAPWSEKAKYIYVTRNPKDACVSYFHHMTNTPLHMFNGTFDQFFELFITGNIDYGDFFDHLLGWYEHRNDPNVLFFTYEEIKKDTKAAVLKIASFLDDEKFAEPLRQDPEKLNNVLEYSSFKHMQEMMNKGMDEFMKMSTDNPMLSELPDAMKAIMSEFSNLKDKMPPPNPTNFVRKGIVGDWRNYFSEDQSRRMDEKFAERTKGTDIAEWWKDFM